MLFAWAPARVAIFCSYFFEATNILSNSQLSTHKLSCRSLFFIIRQDIFFILFVLNRVKIAHSFHQMDTISLFIVSVTISLWVVWQGTQINKQKEDKLISVMQFASNTIAGILIMVLLYSDTDIMLLSLLLIICLPFTLFSSYKMYNADKRRFLSSAALLSGFLIVVWTAAFFLGKN